MSCQDYLLSIDLGLINFSYCLISIKTEKIIKWDVITIGSSKDTYETSCSSLSKYLTTLDLTKINNTVGRSNMIIVVELQPHVNVKTLVMSGQVQMFYVLEKAKNKHLTDPSYCFISKIVGYHARNKLKYYEPQEGDEPLDLSSLKNSYYKNKKMSKEHCRRVLKQKNETNWAKFLEDHKKKDDLADAALMGFAYIKFVLGLKVNKSVKKSEMSEMSEMSEIPEILKDQEKEKEQILDNPERYPAKIPDKICKGKTKHGIACKYAAKKGSYCKIHKQK